MSTCSTGSSAGLQPGNALYINQFPFQSGGIMGLVSTFAVVVAFLAAFLAFVLRELPYERFFHRRRVAWLLGILGAVVLLQAAYYEAAKERLNYETSARRKCTGELATLMELDPRRTYRVVEMFNLKYYLITDEHKRYKIISQDDLPKDAPWPLWKDTEITVDAERHLQVMEK